MKAVCAVCPHRCALEEGQVGLCRARVNQNGEVVAANYGRVTALAIDPIEKKPLRRFLPGSKILSVGSYGCNLRCPFCQNHEIAAAGGDIECADLSPEALVQRALSLKSRGNVGLAFTYNEPLVGLEYVRDCAHLARGAGLKTVLVTNGYARAEAWGTLLPLIDAMNIDLKGFTEAFYRVVGGDLETVKANIQSAAKTCRVEVTTLIVPGLNDSEEDMAREAAWLASIDENIPLHISRFFPRHEMTKTPPTPVETIFRLRDAAAKTLNYVYTGNC